MAIHPTPHRPCRRTHAGAVCVCVCVCSARGGCKPPRAAPPPPAGSRGIV